jgi:hypothetical protein
VKKLRDKKDININTYVQGTYGAPRRAACGGP